MLFLDEIKSLTLTKRILPDYLEVTEEGLPQLLDIFNKHIGEAKSMLALNEISDLFDIDSQQLKQLIVKHLKLLQNYYHIDLEKDPKESHNELMLKIVRFIDLKRNEDPIRYFSVVLGLLRFSGIMGCNGTISKYELTRVLKKSMLRIRLPNNVRDEHVILKYLCKSGIEEYPDILIFLTVNYCIDVLAEVSKSNRVGVSVLEVYLANLATKLKENRREKAV